jgi:hypothetical protein
LHLGREFVVNGLDACAIEPWNDAPCVRFNLKGFSYVVDRLYDPPLSSENDQAFLMHGIGNRKGAKLTADVVTASNFVDLPIWMVFKDLQVFAGALAQPGNTRGGLEWYRAEHREGYLGRGI